ncbi:MAG: alpha/beta hydrolase [Verrucomicrobiota bacterium]
MTSSEIITFKSKGIKIVGNLYLPNDFELSKNYEGIVMTPPFPQVKDQVLGNYGPKMVERGYVTLSLDWNSKGESGTYEEGFRDDENIPRKWEDLRNAISYLGSLPFVGSINGLGFCGGGGIMASTIISDMRVKAFASVSAMLVTDMITFGDKNGYISRIKAANDARQKMFETGQAMNSDAFGYTDSDFLKKNVGAPAGFVGRLRLLRHRSRRQTNLSEFHQ